MDEADFRRLLDLFPVVRSRDYRSVSHESLGGSTSSSAQNEINEWNNAWPEVDTESRSKYEDRFWSNLKSAASRQATKEEAERFCKAFQQIYRKLVDEKLSLESAWKFVDAGPRLTG